MPPLTDAARWAFGLCFAATAAASPPAGQAEADIALLAAIVDGDLAAADRALWEGASPTARDIDGKSALALACLRTRPPICARLIAGGAARDRSDTGEVLVVAAGLGMMASVKLLIAAGADVSFRAPGNGHITPLILSAYAGQTEVVRALLAAGADANVVNDLGEAALHTSGASARADGIVPLLLAARGRTEKTDNNGRTALMVHAQEGHAGAVAALLAAGAAVNATDKLRLTALMLAASNGHDRVVAQLLDARARLDAAANGGLTALAYAAVNERLDTIKLLIARGARLDRDASRVGDLLTTVATYGPATMIGPLVKLGAEVNAVPRDPARPTPLLATVGADRVDCARALLDAGAAVGQGNGEGATPLLIAAYLGKVPFVELLVERGADVNATNQLGSSPVRAAAETGQVLVLRWLLAHGARRDLRDVFGRLPIDYAREGHHTEAAKLLEAR